MTLSLLRILPYLEMIGVYQWTNILLRKYSIGHFEFFFWMKSVVLSKNMWYLIPEFRTSSWKRMSMYLKPWSFYVKIFEAAERVLCEWMLDNYS